MALEHEAGSLKEKIRWEQERAHDLENERDLAFMELEEMRMKQSNLREVVGELQTEHAGFSKREKELLDALELTRSTASAQLLEIETTRQLLECEEQRTEELSKQLEESAENHQAELQIIESWRDQIIEALYNLRDRAENELHKSETTIADYKKQSVAVQKWRSELLEQLQSMRATMSVGLVSRTDGQLLGEQALILTELTEERDAYQQQVAALEEVVAEHDSWRESTMVRLEGMREAVKGYAADLRNVAREREASQEAFRMWRAEMVQHLGEMRETAQRQSEQTLIAEARCDRAEEQRDRLANCAASLERELEELETKQAYEKAELERWRATGALITQSQERRLIVPVDPAEFMRAYVQKCVAESMNQSNEAPEIVLTYVEPKPPTFKESAPIYGPFLPPRLPETKINYGNLIQPKQATHDDLEARRAKEIENFDKWYKQQVRQITATLSLPAPVVPEPEEPKGNCTDSESEQANDDSMDDSLSAEVENLMGLISERASTPEPEDPMGYLLRPYAVSSRPSYIV